MTRSPDYRPSDEITTGQVLTVIGAVVVLLVSLGYIAFKMVGLL